MGGNVWEWTASVAEHYPGNSTASKLYGANLYIVRGGGWFDVKEQVASYYRNSAVPTTANDDLGFRCAK
jgi:formylglycine-generating enzyme required for sulfatase activity